MVQIHSTTNTSNNDGFRSMPTETEATLSKHHHSQCPRRFWLGWTHLVILVGFSIAVGVGFTMEFHCNNSNDHPIKLSSKDLKPHSDNNKKHVTTPFIGFDSIETMPTKQPPPSNNTTTTTPQVAWLMSFPNSGTSFTSKMVRHFSQQSTASNYGEELLDESGKSIPIFNDDGPFWIDPQGGEFNYTRPTTYALTKTHCGGRCEKCGPSKFVENPHSFLTQCLSGKIAHTNSNGKVIKEVVQYDKALVKRAVHLIRSPFDNVVSRFHLELHGFAHRNDTKMMQMYPSSRTGFRKFCQRLNAVYEEEEETSRFIDSHVFELMRNIPCRDDFLRYIQWHNLAIVVTQSLQIPTLIVHYEDYETRYNETAMKMMQFLELEPTGELIQFIKGKEYVEYFTLAEQARVKEAMQILALSSTWEQIAHYFE